MNNELLLESEFQFKAGRNKKEKLELIDNNAVYTIVYQK